MRNLGPEQVFREVAAMVDAPAVKAA
jgi:hypothetical protein